MRADWCPRINPTVSHRDITRIVGVKDYGVNPRPFKSVCCASPFRLLKKGGYCNLRTLSLRLKRNRLT